MAQPPGQFAKEIQGQWAAVLRHIDYMIPCRPTAYSLARLPISSGLATSKLGPVAEQGISLRTRARPKLLTRDWEK